MQDTSVSHPLNQSISKQPLILPGVSGPPLPVNNVSNTNLTQQNTNPIKESEEREPPMNQAIVNPPVQPSKRLTSPTVNPGILKHQSSMVNNNNPTKKKAKKKKLKKEPMEDFDQIEQMKEEDENENMNEL